jgi:hypothetical protein
MNAVEPNFEGVLMTNYGRNGQQDFKLVTGAQGPLWFGSKLYQVSMGEQNGDPVPETVTINGGGFFTVDPKYTYQAIRGQGVEILYNNRQRGTDAENRLELDHIQTSVLDQIILKAYVDVARYSKYTTDYLLYHQSEYESEVESVIRPLFIKRGFTLNMLRSGFTPPESMVKAINDRNNSIQKKQLAINDLEVSKVLQDKAKIDAETDRIKAAGLDPRLLQAKYIDALRETSNMVIITDGKSIPMINVNRK